MQAVNCNGREHCLDRYYEAICKINLKYWQTFQVYFSPFFFLTQHVFVSLWLGYNCNGKEHCLDCYYEGICKIDLKGGLLDEESRSITVHVIDYFAWIKATTGGPWRSSLQAFNLVSFEQSHHKLMWLYAGGPPKLPLGCTWGSSVPFKQRAITPKKIAGPTFVPVTMSKVVVLYNINVKKSFLVFLVGVLK